MCAHRLLHARKAVLTSVGCSSRARQLARLSSNWIASELHLPPVSRAYDTKAAPIASQQLSVFCLLVCPGSFANVAVHSSTSWPRLSVARQGAPQGDVHCQLSSVKQREPGCEDLDAPSSSALTATFMSRSRQLNRTLAPASRRTRPKSSQVPLPLCVIVLSVGKLLCAAPCCPPNHRIRTCFLSQPEATSAFQGS